MKLPVHVHYKPGQAAHEEAKLQIRALRVIFLPKVAVLELIVMYVEVPYIVRAALALRAFWSARMCGLHVLLSEYPGEWVVRIIITYIPMFHCRAIR